MTEPVDWSIVTFDGLRRRQQREFLALPLREKLERIEETNELIEYFAKRRAERAATARGESGEGKSGTGGEMRCGNPGDS